MNHILIIEDESVIRSALRRLLERHDYRVSEAASVEEAESLGSYDLILTDLRLPGKPGTEVIHMAGDVPVIIMTSYASVSSAVEAMKLGAVDYLAKPFDHDELLLMVKKTLGNRLQQRRTQALQSDVDQTFPVDGMIGRSQAMRAVCERIHKIAPTDATVLILGESGTGKELVARALHKQSHRADAPFIAFNCAAVPEQAIETELFGNVPHEGLFHAADGGTLFLDEIGELPSPVQGRLLRLLQQDNPSDTSQPDARVIAASHRDIRQLVQDKLFRSDLYFRLRVMELTLPPLRQRDDDIIELAVYLLDRTCKQLGRESLTLSRETLLAIRRYSWPGNVRELSNAIERAVILCEGSSITPELLAIDHHVGGPEASADVGEKLSLEEYFRVFVLEHQDNMNETELAAALGISRKTLWERRQRYGLPRKRNR